MKAQSTPKSYQASKSLWRVLFIALSTVLISSYGSLAYASSAEPYPTDEASPEPTYSDEAEEYPTPEDSIEPEEYPTPEESLEPEPSPEPEETPTDDCENDDSCSVADVEENEEVEEEAEETGPKPCDGEPPLVNLMAPWELTSGNTIDESKSCYMTDEKSATCSYFRQFEIDSIDLSVYFPYLGIPEEETNPENLPGPEAPGAPGAPPAPQAPLAQFAPIVPGELPIVGGVGPEFFTSYGYYQEIQDFYCDDGSWRIIAGFFFGYYHADGGSEGLTISSTFDSTMFISFSEDAEFSRYGYLSKNEQLNVGPEFKDNGAFSYILKTFELSWDGPPVPTGSHDSFNFNASNQFDEDVPENERGRIEVADYNTENIMYIRPPDLNGWYYVKTNKHGASTILTYTSDDSLERSETSYDNTFTPNTTTLRRAHIDAIFNPQGTLLAETLDASHQIQGVSSKSLSKTIAYDPFTFQLTSLAASVTNVPPLSVDFNWSEDGTAEVEISDQQRETYGKIQEKSGNFLITGSWPAIP